MEDLDHEGTAFLEIPDSRVSLFRGVSGARNRASVVVRQHRFDRNPPHSDTIIEQHLHSVFAHVKVRHPYYCTPLEILFKQSDSEYFFSYVLEAQNAEERKASTPAEVHSFLLTDSQTLHPERIEDIAAAYGLQDEPFLQNADAKFYRGQYSGARRIPVIVKKYKFNKLEKASTQKSISQCLTAALLQAQHPHCCALLEVLVRFKKKRCTIFHVLEALPTSVSQEIEEKARQSESYTEQELWAFLHQASAALAYSHSHSICHGDLNPGSFYRDGEEFRVLDLGCHLMQGKQDGHNIISPQQRQRGMGLIVQFNAMKADVFALGATALWMATAKPPTILVGIENLDQNVAKVITALPYSEQLKTHLRMIVAENEEKRPTMKEIHSALPEALREAARDNEKLRQDYEELRQALSEAARDNEKLQQALNEAARDNEELRQALKREQQERKLGSESIQIEIQRQPQEKEERLPQDEEEVVVQQPEQNRLMPLILLTRESLAELVNVDSIMPDFPSPFFPIVITGSLGKSSLLKSLLDSSVSCKSRKDDLDGLCVWPKPVLLGQIPVLLLKLRKE